MSTFENLYIYSYSVESQVIENELVDIEVPLICPFCKNTGKQNIIAATAYFGKHDKYDGCSLSACSYCGSNSVNYYELDKDNSSHVGDITFKLVCTSPQMIKSDDIPDLITEKFPRFTKIYNQSKQAFEDSLDEIAGMGFRKSIEILITDFLKDFTPEGVNDEWLENPKTSLSQKIDKLGSKRLITLSKTISYLGNDETHYTRRHEEHDTKSLLAFIKPLLSEIENELTYIEAENFLKK